MGKTTQTMSPVKQVIRRVLWQVAYGLSPWNVYRSFPFDRGLPMGEGAAKVLRSCCSALENIGVIYRLTDGTILGLYRERGFIKHDNDIDVDIMLPCAVDKIESAMRRLGMTLGAKVLYKSKLQQLVYYSADHIIFDMVLWRKQKDSVVNYSEEGYKRMQAARFFDHLGTIEFQENVYPCPSDLEDWLEMRFGKGWRTPKTYKGDWKEDCGDIQTIWWPIRLYSDAARWYQKVFR